MPQMANCMCKDSISFSEPFVHVLVRFFHKVCTLRASLHFTCADCTPLPALGVRLLYFGPNVILQDARCCNLQTRFDNNC